MCVCVYIYMYVYIYIYIQELNFKRYIIASLYGKRVIKEDLTKYLKGEISSMFNLLAPELFF